MVKPIIYCGADSKYYYHFSGPLINSAHKHGMEVNIKHFGNVGKEACFMRWRTLPNLLGSHPAVLLVDIDSIINAPIEIDDDSDLGIFFRPDCKDQRMKVLGGAIYVTDRAMDFADDMAKKAAGTGHNWMDDQMWVWDTFCKYRDKYTVKTLTEDFICWDESSKALITTGKGDRKLAPWFKKMMAAHAMPHNVGK